MPSNLVQIGPLVISKDVLDFLSPLIGTLIGGLIAYLSIRASENRKRMQEKQDKIQEQKREALKIALQWIDTIHQAIASVNYRPDPTNKNWPDLVTQLVKYDVPRHLAVFLPNDTYKRSFEIINLLEDLRAQLMFQKEPINDEESNEFIHDAGRIIGDLHKKETEFTGFLEEEYKKTFDIAI